MKMMNNDMLQNIDYLREKADVSYEEAATLLERFDGNVMRVLVELEHEGRVYNQAPSGQQEGRQQARTESTANCKGKASNFVDNAFRTRLVVEQKGEDGEKRTVANLSAPFAVGVAICAPWLTIASAGIAFVTGHSVKIKKENKDGE